jgi:hypothetical protein
MSHGSNAAKAHPLDKDERVFVLETLRQEAMALFSQQRAIADKGARALGLGATVLGGFAAYGIAGKADGHELLLRALPVALALIGIELLQNFIAETAIARARMAIEDALACHLHVRVLVYDRYVRFRKGVTPLGIFVGVVFLALYGGVVYLTQWKDACNDAPRSAEHIVLWARIATGLTGSALLVVLVVILFQQMRSSVPLKIEMPPRGTDSET